MIRTVLVFAIVAFFGSQVSGFQEEAKPLATIDLATQAGVQSVSGQWKYSDVKIVNSKFLAAGDDGQPGDQANSAYDIEPKAGAAGFDDSAWETIAPESLSKRRTAGRISFNWYRIKVKVPEKIGDFDPTGSRIVFETSVDDYAEIWVDGELARPFGQKGGAVVSGWNSGNRLEVGRNVKPGQEIELAVFGINGPISQSPTNYIFMRYAKLHFYGGTWGAETVTPQEVNIEVVKFDDCVDGFLKKNTKLFKLAHGFTFTEGPAVYKGDLYFSDPNENRIYRYRADGRLGIHRDPSGFYGPNFSDYGQPGSNGLAFDSQGRLCMCQHGMRRVSRIEADGKETVLADSFEGKKLNSPNDLVFRKDGSLYFTDPPFGLPKGYDDPAKELDFSGVYRLGTDGKLTLLVKDLAGPNGIAFSPNEDVLYVGDWNEKKKAVWKYAVNSDGSVGAGELLFDLTDQPEWEAIDGVKVDSLGNVYISGPGGLWVVSDKGQKLAQIKTPRHAHNMAWGGKDGNELFLMARSAIYKMPILVPGSGVALEQK